MFLAALFAIAKNVNSQSILQQVILWYLHTMEYGLAIKTNKLIRPSNTLDGLMVIMCSEQCQSQRLHNVPLCNILKMIKL